MSPLRRTIASLLAVVVVGLVTALWAAEPRPPDEDGIRPGPSNAKPGRAADQQRSDRRSDRPDQMRRPRHPERQKMLRHDRPPIRPEQVHQIMEMLSQVHPELAERIRRRMGPDTPLTGTRAMRFIKAQWPRIGPRMVKLWQLKQSDPVLYELTVSDIRTDREIRRLAMQIRAAEMPEDEEVDQFKQAIAKHFQIRQRKLERELEQLEKRIAQVKTRLKGRLQRREEFEQQRFNQLLGRAVESEW